MLAQLFNPTEIKKNGPATRPAIAPARRSASPFRAALAVLPATCQRYGAARSSSKTILAMDELMFEGAVPDGGIQFGRNPVRASAVAFAPATAFSVSCWIGWSAGESADDADACCPNEARNRRADWRTCRGRLEVR
jgi:hypothetical protein